MPMLKLRGLLVCGTGVLSIAAPIVLSLPRTMEQGQTPAETISTESPQAAEWQKAAGGNMQFEVASIKLADPDKFTPPTFALDFLDSFNGTNPHGRFFAVFSLAVYIEFAYKLWPSQ